MARYFRVICAIGMDSGTPADQLANTWHFVHDGYPPLTTPEDSANDMVDQLESFYNNASTSIMGTTINGTVTCKVYDLADPEPRVPVLIRALAVGGGVATSLPHEVAVCLSMKAAVAAGENARRRRGRVYVGPIANTVPAALGPLIVVSTAQRDGLIATATTAFHTGLTAQDPYVAVYSPTTDIGADLADSIHPVVEFYVDNAFDTQRRRGSKATSRSTYVVPGR